MPLIAGASLLVGAYGASQAGDAADEMSDEARRAGARTQRQFEQTRADLSSYRVGGDQAYGVISRLLGLGGAAPDLSEFQESPGYQFRLAEGNKALDRSAAGRGMLLSGAQLKEAQRYNQGMASNEFGNFFNRLYELAGMGQNAAAQTGNFGANAVAQQNQLGMMGAGARAQGIADQTNFITNALGGAANAYGQRGTSGYQPNDGGFGTLFGTLGSQGAMNTPPPSNINQMWGGYA